jgi:hypothetical protein
MQRVENRFHCPAARVTSYEDVLEVLASIERAREKNRLQSPDHDQKFNPGNAKTHGHQYIADSERFLFSDQDF